MQGISKYSRFLISARCSFKALGDVASREDDEIKNKEGVYNTGMFVGFLRRDPSYVEGPQRERGLIRDSFRERRNCQQHRLLPDISSAAAHFPLPSWGRSQVFMPGSNASLSVDDMPSTPGSRRHKATSQNRMTSAWGNIREGAVCHQENIRIINPDNGRTPLVSSEARVSSTR